MGKGDNTRPVHVPTFNANHDRLDWSNKPAEEPPRRVKTCRCRGWAGETCDECAPTVLHDAG